MSDGAIVILGISKHLPLPTPLAISTSKTFSPSFKMINCVPFLNSLLRLAHKFLNRITGAPTFSDIAWGGISERVMDLRKSVGYAFCKSSSETVFAER